MNDLKKIKNGICLSAIFIMSACSNDFDFESHYPGEAEKKEYTRNWIKQFGEMDPNHTWNMCTSYEVKVSTSQSSNIQIYALVDDKYKIVADYENVIGDQTLQFDAIAGVTDIYVSNGVKAVPSKIGETVSFDNTTRGGIYSETGEVKVYRTNPSEWKIFYENDYNAWETVVPQQGANRNSNKISKDFTFVAETDTIIIYPVLWGTSQVDIYGIYYMDENNVRQEVDFYQIKSGDELQYKNGTGTNYTPNSSSTADINSREESVYKNSAEYQAMLNDPDYVVGSFKPAQWTRRGTFLTGYTYTMSTPAYYIKESWKDCPKVKYLVPGSNRSVTAGVSPEIIALRSKGVKIYVGKGREIGIYLNNITNTIPNETYDNIESGSTYRESENGMWYSEASLNTRLTTRDKSLAATFMIGDVKYIGMEDKPYDNTIDLNDVIFRIEGVATLDKEADQWTIACEDLGETDDYDFNDLVFNVSHISGKTKAVIKPLAAGGVLEAHYGFDAAKSSTANNEIHGRFTKNGSTAGKDGNNDYYMINTNADATHNGYNAEDQEITVASDFSLATNMGGFWIKVTGKDNVVRTITAPVHSLHSASATSETPQMILVPSGWKWPNERIPISEAYSNFYDWNANMTAIQRLNQWLDCMNENKVY